MSYQVEISALSDNALINLRGAKSALAQFESALEMEFPKSAQAVCSREGITVLSLAPDHWWVRTAIQNEGQTFDTLAGAVATEHAAVTVVTDHFSGFSIVGVSPFAHKTKPTNIFIDKNLDKYESVYAAAGHPFVIFGITFEDLTKITKGKVVSIVE